jgi:hypothetical protein
MDDVVLAIGTRKGLFTARSRGGRADWDFQPIRLTAAPVTAVAIDPNPLPDGGRRLLAALSDPFWGTTLLSSHDLGRTWSEPTREQARAAIAFPEGTGATLERIWQLRYSPTDPAVVYAGVEPAALFRSADGGQTFQLVEGLWEHPHRPKWQPGGGGLCLHTVLPDPADPATVTVAISAAGVYRTTDGGATWTARNQGIRVDFVPEDDPFPEFGQCVHKIDLHPTRPDRLFLQHHGGVYRSDDGAASWTRIDTGLPSDFGFPIVVHPRRPDTAYVLPLSAEDRAPVDYAYRVYRTDDAGAGWQPLTTGLPADPCYGSVLRDAMCADDADPVGIYFGTRDGSVFAGVPDGESWTEIVRHLPDVFCVRAAVL